MSVTLFLLLVQSLICTALCTVNHWKSSAPVVDGISNLVEKMQCDVVTDIDIGPYPSICNYGPTDHVSSPFSKGKTYEANTIEVFIGLRNLLQVEHGLEGVGFLDFGSNIGVFTVNMAARGASVLCVDGNRDNLHLLQSSLQKNLISGEVILVNNALSNVTGDQVHFNINEANVGGTDMFASTGHAVETIQLDDLLPIIPFKKAIAKFDIQRSEARTIVAAKKFFEEIDAYVLMIEGPWPEELLDYLFEKGYSSFPRRDRLPVPRNEQHTVIAWFVKQPYQSTLRRLLKKYHGNMLLD